MKKQNIDYGSLHQQHSLMRRIIASVRGGHTKIKRHVPPVSIISDDAKDGAGRV